MKGATTCDTQRRRCFENGVKVLNLAAEPAKLRAGPTIQANEGERVLIVLSAGVFAGRSVRKAQPSVRRSGAGAIENGVKDLNLVAEPAKLRAGPTIHANEGQRVLIVLCAVVFAGRSVRKAQPRVTPSGAGASKTVSRF